MNCITDIKINHLRFLHDLDIKITDGPLKHLIITGKNGSGKTTLLRAIFDNLKLLAKDNYRTEEELDKHVRNSQNKIKIAEANNNSKEVVEENRYLKLWKEEKEEYYGKVKLTFSDFGAIYKAVHDHNFILAYYNDFRQPNFKETTTPQKPNFTVSDFSNNKLDQFLLLLVDYKIQAALANNEGNKDYAEGINKWFEDFTGMLRQLFGDPQLALEFKYSDYSFLIHTGGKQFKFTQMSAGYRAALDIIADLIFKMQRPDKIVRAFDQQGIVCIDEVETHLHLELQKQILPLLIRFFPHIQFIVTTHSPFVLNSADCAVAYDLEHQQMIGDLSEYSYDTLTEGYFGVDLESSKMMLRLSRLQALAQKPSRTLSEQKELQDLISDFDKIPEALAPSVKGQFLKIKRTIAQ